MNDWINTLYYKYGDNLDLIIYFILFIIFMILKEN